MQIDQNSTFGDAGATYTTQLDKTKLTSKDKIRVFMGGGDTLYVSDAAPCGSGSSEYYDNGNTLLGDASGDGIINSKDAGIILSWLVSQDSVSKDQMQAMDTSDDATAAVNSKDAGVILSWLVSQDDTLGEKTISQKKYFVNVNN